VSGSNSIRGSEKHQKLGHRIGRIIRHWTATLRVTVDDTAGALSGKLGDTPCIYLLWHNRVSSAPAVWMRISPLPRPIIVLASPSKDGAVVASAMEALGMRAVRGSSSRRGAAALVAMKREIDSGCDAALTPDGPKGPRYQLQPGVVKLAQATGAWIVPVHLVCPRAIRLKTWDRIVLPLPFSSVTLRTAPALRVEKQLDDETFENERQRIEAALLSITDDINPS